MDKLEKFLIDFLLLSLAVGCMTIVNYTMGIEAVAIFGSAVVMKKFLFTDDPR